MHFRLSLETAPVFPVKAIHGGRAGMTTIEEARLFRGPPNAVFIESQKAGRVSRIEYRAVIPAKAGIQTVIEDVY